MLNSYLKDFEKIYTEKIYPDLKKAEQIRKKILLNYTIIGTVLFGGMLVEAITWMSIAIFIIILFVLVYTRWYGIPVSKYEKSYIHAITANIIEFIHPGLQVDHSSHLKLIEIKNAHIITGEPEYFAGKNLIYGNINGQNIRISEITATSKYKKENGIEHTYEYFNGIVIAADTKPEINGNLMICSSNELLKYYLPIIKDIKIENIDQEELTVFSDDDKAVKKYATPQLLNVLREYHLHTDNNVMYSVNETGFCLAILHNRKFNYLDPSVFSSAYNKKVVEIYYRDIRFLIGTLMAEK